MKKYKMVSVFAGNHSASRRGFLRLSRVPPTSRVFTSGYVNTEIILHFFYKITNERGTKTVFTYAHGKWFYGQSVRAYYLNYFVKVRFSRKMLFWKTQNSFESVY